MSTATSPSRARLPAASSSSVAARLRARLTPYVNTPLNAALTVAVAAVLALTLPDLLRWAVLDAAFLPAVPETCAAREGACWSFVVAKSGQILFGIYPPSERWRPALACMLILALLGWSVRPASWRPALALLWLGNLVAVVWLMGGGLGLAAVPTSAWGGLPVTLLLTVVAIGIGFPLAILLALGRRSALPAVSMNCAGFAGGYLV